MRTPRSQEECGLQIFLVVANSENELQIGFQKKAILFLVLHVIVTHVQQECVRLCDLCSSSLKASDDGSYLLVEANG